MRHPVCNVSAGLATASASGTISAVRESSPVAAWEASGVGSGVSPSPLRKPRRPDLSPSYSTLQVMGRVGTALDVVAALNAAADPRFAALCRAISADLVLVEDRYHAFSDEMDRYHEARMARRAERKRP